MSDYTCKTFSLGLPKGEGQGSVPNLLKHLSNTLEKMDIDVIDMVYSMELDDDGDDWPVFTVYYNDKERLKQLAKN